MAARWLLGITAVMFVALGLNGLLNPVGHLAPYGLELATPGWLGEVRANYGGMHLAMGVLFLFGAWLEQWRRPALILIAAFCGGLVLGRLVSIGAEGWPNPFVTQLLVVEVVATAIAVALLVADRKMA